MDSMPETSDRSKGAKLIPASAARLCKRGSIIARTSSDRAGRKLWNLLGTNGLHTLNELISCEPATRIIAVLVKYDSLINLLMARHGFRRTTVILRAIYHTFKNSECRQNL